jgi:hypothetical protein
MGKVSLLQFAVKNAVHSIGVPTLQLHLAKSKNIVKHVDKAEPKHIVKEGTLLPDLILLLNGAKN